MKLVTIRAGQGGGEGALDVPGGYRTLRSLGLPADVRSFIAAGPQAWDGARQQGLSPDYGEDTPLLAPIPDPVNIIGIGLNYLDHCREQGIEPPKTPILFSKFRSSIVGPDDKVRRIEVLRFAEPPEYHPRDGWLAQFEGHTLAPDLSLKGSIRAMTGATLTSNAVTRSVRRVLALHRRIHPFAPAAAAGP